MAGKLYPPYINGTLPAFWLNYDASNSIITGASITIPFSENPAVGNAVKGYKLRLRTASTGSYLFEPIYTVQKDAEAREVTFELQPSQAKKLKEGQYYKAQIAYCGDSEDDVGYFSTVGVIKCTSKPTISISNLSLDNINFFANEFIGLYDLSNCRDQTEKVYSYSFQMFDENGDIYYDTGELLHNASYDTEYGYSIDRVSINEFVAQDVTYSIQYNVTTLNGLQLSTGQYKLTNQGFNSLSRDIQILPESNLDNGYITINFKGELDKDRSFYYVLNEEFLNSEKDNNNEYLIDNNGKTAIKKIMEGIMANNSHILYMKTYDIYRYYNNGLNQPFVYSSQLKEFQDKKKIIIIDDKKYYCDEEVYNNINNLQSKKDEPFMDMSILSNDQKDYIDNIENQILQIQQEAQQAILALQPEDFTIYEDYLAAVNNIQNNMTQNLSNLRTELNNYYIECIEENINNQPLYLLVATGKDLTKSLTYNYVEKNNYFVDETKTYLMDGFGNFYYLIDQENYEAFYYGAFLLSRASDEDNYSTWINIEKFRLEEQPPSSHSVKDFTIEHGHKYIYALQQYNIWGLYSTRVISDVYLAGFEDAFLYDGERALKIRFNPEISSFKTTILEQKTDTLGGRFPYITRNGDTYYKEFPIGGLIAQEMDEEELFINRHAVTSHRHSTSAVEAYEPVNGLRDYHMFSDENIMLERQFKLEVLNWLNDGKPKLFKSPYEGNYIVRLMNTSLTPVKELGRMLHSFQSTAYEIAECNYDNLVRFGFIKLKDPSDFVGLWKTHDLSNYTLGEDITINFDGGLVSFSIQDMVPGDIVEIIYESGIPATEKIMIGITGAYMCAGINRPIAGIHIPPRHLVPNMGDKNQQKMTGIINCYYKGARITKFDAITNMQLKTIPSYQFIGVDPSLEEMKRKDWTKKNNNGTFVDALKEDGYEAFQGYSIRDYIDKIIERPETNDMGTVYFISDEGQQYINAFDPGDLVSRINATINLGEADKIQLIKLEQGHFRLRELVPVYTLNDSVAKFSEEKTWNKDWLVSVSPFGYPYPIEELIEFKMIDPFCIFEVFQLIDGYWQPVKGFYGSPYYDPYYKKWLYDYEPYFQMNYQEKKISYLGVNEELSLPYKRSDLTFTTDSETGKQYYLLDNVKIPEERIYDIEIQKEINDKGEDCYYYVDSVFYDSQQQQHENRVYLTIYNYYDQLQPIPKGASSATPIPNAVYYIKKYDNVIDLSIIKEKHYKDFENINMIRIGNGIIAELTFQIKVIDYYTENSDPDVLAAKNDYLAQAAFYRNIMGAYAVIAKAYQTKKKNSALMNLYERLLRGKTGGISSEMSDEDISIIRQQLGYDQDKEDLALLTVYEAILLDQNNLGDNIVDLLLEYFNNINLKISLKQETDISTVKDRLDQVLIYATPYFEYTIIDLTNNNTIAGKKPEEEITLDNISEYNYYVYTDWDTRESQYYFARKKDINDWYRLHQSFIKDYIAIDPTGKIIENINQYSQASIQILNKIDYDKIYNEVLVALNNDDYISYLNEKNCMWIQKFNKTSLHEETEIENILQKGTISEGSQNKLQIIEKEIEEFNNIIDDLSTQSSNVDVEYAKVYDDLVTAIDDYNRSSYFEWCVRHLIYILSDQSPSDLSLQLMENTLNNNLSNLVSYDSFVKSYVKQIYEIITEIQYQLAQDFEKTRLYDRIIKDKENDIYLDEYNTRQIAISRGRILKCAYEAYFSGQKILQLLIFYWDNCNETTILNAIETYKNIYTIFSNSFKQCLNDDEEIDQEFIIGLKDYYNDLLTEYKNLMAQIKSNWDSSQLVDIDQYKQSILFNNELYFLYFILNINHDDLYMRTNLDLSTHVPSLSPILQSDNSNILVQQINDNLLALSGLFNNEDLISSYVTKDYDLNQYQLTSYTTSNAWMYIKNITSEEEEEEVQSYMDILLQVSGFRTIIAVAQAQQVHYFNFYNPKTEEGSSSRSIIIDTSFIFNPLKEFQHRFVLEKLPYNNLTQYYVFDSTREVFHQVTLTDGFEENTEYYIQINKNGYYQPVFNVIPESTLKPYTGEEIINEDLVQLYYYDEESQSYQIEADINNIKYNIPYYARTVLDNKSYFDSLTNEQQNTVLNISFNANTILNELNNWLLQNINTSQTTNSTIIQNLQNLNTLKRLKEALNIINQNEAKEKVRTALSAYNNLINTYQQTLKKNEHYRQYIANYNSKNGTNFVLSEDGEDILYSMIYADTPSIPNNNDQYSYFYTSEYTNTSCDIEDLIPINNMLPNGKKPDAPQYDTIYILDKERLKFFSIIDNMVTNDSGVVAWYKELFIDAELQYYKQLLQEAIELHDLYDQQYTDYQGKYETYSNAAIESNEIYNNYRGTPELDYYLNNDSSKFDELRKKVKEAWWKFLNLLDERYTAEKARGMYL